MILPPDWTDAMALVLLVSRVSSLTVGNPERQHGREMASRALLSTSTMTYKASPIPGFKFPGPG